MVRLLFCLSVVLLACTNQSSEAQNLLPSALNSFIVEVPNLPVLPGQSRYYGGTTTNPAWLVAQWGIVGQKLSPFVQLANGSLASYAGANSVKIKDSTLTINQNGSFLPCSYPSGKPHEFDLFFAPNEQHFASLYTLSSLASLTQIVDIKVNGASLSRKTCRVNMGYSLIGIVLIDQIAHPAQTFFYQLELSQVCHAVPNGQRCNISPTHAFYYFRTNPFGADEYEPMLGHPFFLNNTSIHFSANLLPRLKAIIQNGPPGLDHAISHWIVANAYYGQHIWGGVRLKTSWSNLKLIARLRP